MAELSLCAMVSGLQDWDKMAISSAYKASWISGGVWNISNIGGEESSGNYRALR